MTLFRWWRRGDDLKAEIRSHLDEATEDRVARGISREEAERSARRELGNVGQIQEATRDVWGWRWLEHLVQDLRYATRVFNKNRGFAAVAIVSLALGIGANTALFQVVDAVRLRTLPVADPGSLVDVHIVDMAGARGSFETWYPAVTYPIWREIEARQQAFSGIFAWGTDRFNLSTGGEVRPARGLWVSGEFFNVLGVRPIVGRTLGPDDDRPGCPARAVLSFPFWQRTYGGDPSVVGRTLTRAPRPVGIVGVAPPGFFGLEGGRPFDVALPVCSDPVFSDDHKGRLESGTDWWLGVFGRLKPGWTRERATAHLATISPALFQSAIPATYPPVSVSQFLNFKLAAYPAKTGLSMLREDYESPLWLLLALAALVLVIACANLANLLLARATAREREIAIRLGLGASRSRVVRQLLTESLLLAASGTFLGVILAGMLSKSLVAFLDARLDMWVDWKVLAFASALAVLTCVLFGLAPALKSTRVGAGAVMRASGRGNTSGRESVALRRGLVVAQVALSLTLLFGSLLFARSLRNVMTVDPGFRPEGIVVAGLNYRRIELPGDGRRSFRRDLVDKVRALPGVQSATTVGIVPLSGNASGNQMWLDRDPTHHFGVLYGSVGSGYFETLHLPLVAGRDFDGRDSMSSEPAVIVNEAFASQLPPGTPTVGARIVREATPAGPEKAFRIVGVVRNSKYLNLKEKVSPVAFMPDTQERAPGYTQLLIRSNLPAATLTAALTTLFGQIDPRISVVYSVLTTDIGDTLLRERLLATLSGGFGLLAAVLTIVGLYGLIAYTVTRRTNEIGVRLALGATRSDIARVILRETGLLLVVGVCVGIVLSLLGGRAAESLLFDIKAYDPLTLAGAVLALAAIAVAASYGPARRATRIEPVAALRVE
jgi:predicted permease